MSGVPPVLLIDGRSGTGKTTLATSVASALTASTVVHMDDLYPGWDGLDEGARLLVEWILRPFAERRVGEWRRWDWERSARAEAHLVPGDRPLVVEGCGASSRASRVLADTAVWLDAPVVQRTDRLVGRGDGVDWLAGWTLQEDAFIEREHPDLDAGLRIEATGTADQVASLVVEMLRRDEAGRWNSWLRA
jgi:hypothetical protein